MTDTPPKDSIIIGVPGLWETHTEMIVALAGAGNGAVIAAGQIMLDTEADMPWGFNFLDADNNLPSAFEMASVYNPLTEDQAAALKAHKSIVYIFDKRRGSKAAISAARCASALLRAGGLGVKIELAGRAFGPDIWLENQPATEAGALTTLHDLFVFPLISVNATEHFSAGMTQLGYPDTAISGVPDLNMARDIIATFNLYQLHEAPHLESGQTFSTGPDAPVFRLQHNVHPYADAQHLDYTPGLWQLLPIGGA